MGSATVALARRLAEDVLLPAAAAADRADRVPPELLDALVDNGFYGLGAPDGLCPLGRTDAVVRAAVIEAFAGGCLAAAFVWQQHRGALRAVAATAPSSLREEVLPQLAAGRLRAGLAIGAATRTGPPVIRARAGGDGWVLTGTAPWVTGWGMVDVLLMAARTDEDLLVWSLLPVSTPGLQAEPLDLLAIPASGTVTLHAHEVSVPAGRVLATEPHSAYLARDAESLSSNGFLALGVAGRAITTIGQDRVGSALAGELARVRDRLLVAGADDAPAARADASELALRAAGALAVHQGSQSVLAGSDADRLVREALLLLTFATRPTIRAQLLTRLSPTVSG